MGGDLRRERFPEYERTIPIGVHFRTRNGGEAVLLSVDLWSDRGALNVAYEITTPPLVAADGHTSVGPDFTVTDDVGTTYRWGAGGGGGADGFALGHQVFRPAVPEAARSLTITSRDLRHPIEVALSET